MAEEPVMTDNLYRPGHWQVSQALLELIPKDVVDWIVTNTGLLTEVNGTLTLELPAWIEIPPKILDILQRLGVIVKMPPPKAPAPDDDKKKSPVGTLVLVGAGLVAAYLFMK